MRVTTIIPDAQYQMQRAEQALSTAEQQVSTGLRVNQLSDDPAAAASMVRSLAATSSVDQYTSNIDALNSQLQTADSAISAMINNLNTAITTGTAAANGTESSANRQAAAAQIQGLLSDIIARGNTAFQGVHLFGGSLTSDPPFVAASSAYTSSAGSPSTPVTMTTPLTAGSVMRISDAATGKTFAFQASSGDTVSTLAAEVSAAVTAGTLSSGTALSIDGFGQVQIASASGIVASSSDPALGSMAATPGSTLSNTYAYVGNSTVNTVQVGESSSVSKNVAGDQLLVNTDVIGSLERLITALGTNNTTQIGSAVSAIGASLQSLSASRVPLDQTMSRLNAQESYLSQEKVTLTSAQNSLVGISLSTAATNLAQAQIANSAVLAAAAKAIPQSLLDYLK